MKRLLTIITDAKAAFREVLLAMEADGGLTEERYIRFLVMQHHLTKGVQRHFYACAAHPSLAHKKALKRFLVDFANEEEPHYLIAAKDLENLKAPLTAAPLDVQLWWAFFDQIVQVRPFVRLGATCILENIASGNGDVIKRLMGAAPFLNPRNSRFLVIHQHEELPHGDQILDALGKADLSAEQYADMEEGAACGTTLYLRLMGWVVAGAPAVQLKRAG